MRNPVAWLCRPLPRRQAGVPHGRSDQYHSASGRLRIRTLILNLVLALLYRTQFYNILIIKVIEDNHLQLIKPPSEDTFPPLASLIPEFL